MYNHLCEGNLQCEACARALEDLAAGLCGGLLSEAEDRIEELEQELLQFLPLRIRQALAKGPVFESDLARDLKVSEEQIRAALRKSPVVNINSPGDIEKWALKAHAS